MFRNAGKRPYIWNGWKPGLGSYTSSALLNRHTRRSHGLPVANLDSPSGRHVLLSKIEDSLQLGDQECSLSCHQYPGMFFSPEFPLKKIWTAGTMRGLRTMAT